MKVPENKATIKIQTTIYTSAESFKKDLSTVSSLSVQVDSDKGFAEVEQDE